MPSPKRHWKSYPQSYIDLLTSFQAHRAATIGPIPYNHAISLRVGLSHFRSALQQAATTQHDLGAGDLLEIFDGFITQITPLGDNQVMFSLVDHPIQPRPPVDEAAAAALSQAARISPSQAKTALSILEAQGWTLTQAPSSSTPLKKDRPTDD